MLCLSYPGVLYHCYSNDKGEEQIGCDVVNDVRDIRYHEYRKGEQNLYGEDLAPTLYSLLRRFVIVGLRPMIPSVEFAHKSKQGENYKCKQDKRDYYYAYWCSHRLKILCLAATFFS